MRRVLTAPFNRSPVPQTTKNGTAGRFFGLGQSKASLVNLQDVNSTVYAIVSKTAESVSMIDWHLFRVT
ncbi:MAG TPA: hypothetical protein V6C65_14210, partial [Allocoleopsis sp.]